MSNIIPVAKKREVAQFIQQNQDKLLASLPKGVDRDRFVAISLQAIAKVPALFSCDKASLFGALVQSVSLGLEPNGPLGEAYILPYGKTANFQMGFRGMIKLIEKSGLVSYVEAVSVDAADEFSVKRGLNPDIIHVPSPNPTGEFHAVYAIARFKDGNTKFEVMFRNDVEMIRSKSKSGNSGPWKEFYNEMAKKSCVRRLFKMVAVSSEIERAIVLDERADAGVSQDFDVDFGDVEEVDNNAKAKGLL